MSSLLDMTFSKMVTSRCALGHYCYAGPGAWGLGNLSYGDSDGAGDSDGDGDSDSDGDGDSDSNGDNDGDENDKKATGLDKQNNDFARVSRFFVHFISVTVRFRITT